MKRIVLSLFFVVSLSVSVYLYSAGHKGARRVFIYPSSSGKILEDRRISACSNEKYAGYVDELLLGPAQETALPIFATGTRAKSCSFSKGTLYVDLSSEAMQSDFKKIGFAARKKLMEKNIKRNFFSVRHLVIFIDGKECL